MCEEESEDHEAVAKLFEINDSIHRTIERYKLFRKGDIEGANKIPKGTLGTSGAGVTKGADNSLNLIDFGDPEPAPAAASGTSGQAAQPVPKGNALEDDLLGLSLGGSTYGQTGGISLGASNGSGTYALQSSIHLLTPSSPVLGLSGVSVPQSPPPQQSSTSTSINDLLGGFSNSGPSSQISSPPPSLSASQKLPSQSSRATPDPFAALTSQSQTPRQASPFQFQQSIKPQTSGPSASGSTDLLGGFSNPPPTQNTAPVDTNANDDDEWTFTSAVPTSSKEITVTNTNVHIVFTVSRESDDVLLIQSRISNNTQSPVSELTFQSAVSKVRKVHPHHLPSSPSFEIC